MSRVATRREVPILLALLLVALTLRPSLSSVGPVLEAIRSTLHLSHGVAGLITSLPVICMGLFAPMAMPLSARWGLKRSVLGMVLLSAGATLLRIHAALFSLLLSSVLIGVAIAGLGPLLSTCIKQEFPERSSRVSAWVTAAICIGAALGAITTAQLSDHVGWPWALASWALLALLAAWQWQRGMPQVAHVRVVSMQALPWRQPRAWLLMLLFGLHSSVFYCMLTWMAPTFISKGYTQATAGHLVGVFTLVQVVGTLLVSALPAQQTDRRPALIASAACSLLGQLAIWLVPLAAPYLWVLLFGIGASGLFALNMILPLDYADSPEMAGSWTAMMCGGGYIISACGPYLCGVLLDITNSFTAMFAAISLVSGIVLAICMLLTPPQALTERQTTLA